LPVALAVGRGVRVPSLLNLEEAYAVEGLLEGLRNRAHAWVSSAVSEDPWRVAEHSPLPGSSADLRLSFALTLVETDPATLRFATGAGTRSRSHLAHRKLHGGAQAVSSGAAGAGDGASEGPEHVEASAWDSGAASVQEEEEREGGRQA
jgi:hypothetical protein